MTASKPSSEHHWCGIEMGGYWGGVKCSRCGRYSDYALLCTLPWTWADILGRWFSRFRCNGAAKWTF